ncbi:hypothetical protein GGTG_08963 [Gaeumannomyces tritici R3-111a-1]|uniref:Rhodopsin domain-containing protein n=1 Tax=Gaeumannomyces tritici (strain R3-111a-1) TaxID=644352 RepID=J3P623_GAET3|nr:hypothetical protein GGTG_08963 [Gaeumannomyces tritici R3-111a-1]EJT75125.1 hypothetical protein GGTG_08963 [Gaeumannomyces tritici R3-111a-1]
MATGPTAMATEAHENRGPMVLAATSVLVFLAAVFGLARFYARTWIRRQVYLDDLFVVVSVVLLLYSEVCIYMAVSNGQGRHVDTLTVQQQERVIFWHMLTVPAVLPALGIPKLVVATILVRILVPGPKARAVAWGPAIMSTLAFIAIVFVVFFQCLPVRAQGTFPSRTRTFSAFVDLYLAVWPAVIFYSMQMSRIKTVGLSIAMGIGAIAAGIAAYKCSNFSGLADPDFSCKAPSIADWSSAEASAIVTAASIPMLAPLYRSIEMSYKRAKRRVCGTPMELRPEPRPENAWDFPTRERMQPRDDAELGRSSLATSQAESWDPRHLYSHARESGKHGAGEGRASHSTRESRSGTHSTRYSTRPTRAITGVGPEPEPGWAESWRDEDQGNAVTGGRRVIST